MSWGCLSEWFRERTSAVILHATPVCPKIHFEWKVSSLCWWPSSITKLGLNLACLTEEKEMMPVISRGMFGLCFTMTGNTFPGWKCTRRPLLIVTVAGCGSSCSADQFSMWEKDHQHFDCWGEGICFCALLCLPGYLACFSLLKRGGLLPSFLVTPKSTSEQTCSQCDPSIEKFLFFLKALQQIAWLRDSLNYGWRKLSLL